MSDLGRDSVRKDMAFIGVLVVIAVALIAYLVIDAGRDPAPATGGDLPAAAQAAGATAAGDGGAPMERREADDPLALGDPDAPVAMVVFSDYRCPFCAKFSRETEPVLIERFVDTGALRIEWRDFPIFGDQSMLAARAGRAAAEQGRFWEFNRAVYAAAPDRQKADFTEQSLIDFATQAGVPDIDAFTASMRGSAFDDAIAADLAQGNSIGVPSTPAFLIDGVPLLGAQPTEEFVRAVDAAVNPR